MKKTIILFGLCFAVMVTPTSFAAGKTVLVRMTTSLGKIDLELYSAKAPRTVENFIQYVKAGSYNGTIFHRVIPGFMIQGGGYDGKLRQQPQKAPVVNEADNGLKNLVGTIAMARTSDPHSASNQFFINTANNGFLNFQNKTPRGWGYAVFGKVVKGLDVVRSIEATPTTRHGPFENLPRTTVTIIKIEEIRP